MDQMVEASAENRKSRAPARMGSRRRLLVRCQTRSGEPAGTMSRRANAPNPAAANTIETSVSQATLLNSNASVVYFQRSKGESSRWANRSHRSSAGNRAAWEGEAIDLPAGRLA